LCKSDYFSFRCNFLVLLIFAQQRLLLFLVLEMEPFQGTFELERGLVEVVVRDRRSRVHADTKGLGCGEDKGNGALDRTLGGLLAALMQNLRSAGAARSIGVLIS
jgi:hypothetical protein